MYDDNVQFEDIADYRIHKFLKPECKNVFDDVVDDDFIYNLKPMEGAVETLNYLSQHFYIYFASAAHPKTLYARDKLLSKTFEWYRTRQLIRCNDKDRLNLDWLGDDCLDNLIYFKGSKMLMNRPWNERLPAYGMKRVYKWKQIYDYFNGDRRLFTKYDGVSYNCTGV